MPKRSFLEERKLKKTSAALISLILIVWMEAYLILPVGAYDDKVFQAQKRLKELGYNPGLQDGILGQTTQNALKDFQREHGLYVTGELDPQTIAELDLPGVSKSDKMTKIITHLQFLGYETVPGDRRVQAKHPRHILFVIKEYRGGLLFTVFFRGTEHSRQKREDFLEFANSFNRRANIARAYISEKGNLVFEAWYPGAYQKTTFSRFLDDWHKDVEQKIREDLQETLKYIK
jgi:hypothetical protein